MKRSEMNLHQREAFDHICSTMSEYIGAYENQLQDCTPDDEEYKKAYEFLHQGHDNLVEIIYQGVMFDSNKSVAKHLRFAGEAFIKERIDRRLTKWGY